MLQREANTPVDKLVVAVVKSGRTVGHVPISLGPVFSYFLKEPSTKAQQRSQMKESIMEQAMGWNCCVSIVSTVQKTTSRELSLCSVMTQWT